MSGWIRVQKKKRSVPTSSKVKIQTTFVDVALAEDVFANGGDERAKRGKFDEEIELSPRVAAKKEDVYVVDSFAESEELSPGHLNVLAAWGREREVRAFSISDSDEVLPERKKKATVASLEEVVDDEINGTASPRVRQVHLESEAVEDDEDNDDQEEGLRGRPKFRGALERVQQDADEILSSSQGSPQKGQQQQPPAAAAVSRPPAAARFVVSGSASAQSSVLLLNRVVAARREVCPEHRVWVLSWTKRATGGTGGAMLLEKGAASARPLLLFSRHACHTEMLCGVWLAHSNSLSCCCAVSSSALVLCEHCTMREDFLCQAASPSETRQSSAANAVLAPLDLVRSLQSSSSINAVATASTSATTAAPVCSSSPSLLAIVPDNRLKPRPGFWSGRDERGNLVLLQCPAELGPLVRRAVIRPTPGLWPVRRESVGGGSECPNVVLVGLISLHFSISFEER